MVSPNQVGSRVNERPSERDLIRVRKSLSLGAPVQSDNDGVGALLGGFHNSRQLLLRRLIDSPAEAKNGNAGSDAGGGGALQKCPSSQEREKGDNGYPVSVL